MITLGTSGPIVARWQHIVRARFSSYALAYDGSPLKIDSYFGNDDLAVHNEWQRRVFRVPTDRISNEEMVMLGVALPVFFTVEGHLSNMFAGPVADSATRLEQEGLCHHQPTGYANGSIPFDNRSATEDLARRVGSTVLKGGGNEDMPFPPGTPILFGGFSQGSIAVFDFYVNYLSPGQPLNWRLKDVIGVLAYGNPCRATDSIAPWATSWIKKPGTFGLDPYRRFGINGLPAKPDYWMDVYREGDIFAENTPDKSGEVKAAVYQAIARGDFFSNPYSLAAQIADLFLVPVEEVLGMVMAIISGIGFLADGQGASHYAPYDLTGGIDWAREQLRRTMS